MIKIRINSSSDFNGWYFRSLGGISPHTLKLSCVFLKEMIIKNSTKYRQSTFLLNDLPNLQCNHFQSPQHTKEGRCKLLHKWRLASCFMGFSSLQTLFISPKIPSIVKLPRLQTKTNYQFLICILNYFDS